MKNSNEDCSLKTLGDGFIREVFKSSRGRVKVENDLTNKSSTKKFYILASKH